MPLSQPHHFPVHLLPSRTNEVRPGSYAGYEKSLSRFISANTPVSAEAEEGSTVKGLDGVEPEVGLTTWTEEMSNLVSALFRKVLG